jgi:hypothetical protein
VGLGGKQEIENTSASGPSTSLASMNHRFEKKGAWMVCWEWEAKGKWTLHDENDRDNPARRPLVFVCLGQLELMHGILW